MALPMAVVLVVLLVPVVLFVARFLLQHLLFGTIVRSLGARLSAVVSMKVVIFHDSSLFHRVTKQHDRLSRSPAG
jgi:hypothetical protein